MAVPQTFGTPFTRFVATMTECAWRLRQFSAHPSHGSWPRSELYPKPEWQDPRGGPAAFWHTPHTVDDPRASSTQNYNGRVHMAAPPIF
eukprot:411623-Pyramimonas_sp.AAC.1